MWERVAWIAATATLVWGQTLELSPSDGEPLFATAGERLRLTVRVRGQELLGAGCRLYYDPPAVVWFAGWSSADFTATQTVVVSGRDTLGQWVDVAVFAAAARRDSLSLVRLEFVVSPEAPHGGIVQFRAVRGWALRGDSLVQLGAATLALPVHGYVEVWPGDANNDGTVDVQDVATIGFYAYRGAAGYRRTPASVEWVPQRARAWAEPAATYADCDGNGVVSVRDIAVVLQNYGASRSGALVLGQEHVEAQPGCERCMWQGYVPPEAAVVVGVCVPCTGSWVTGVEYPATVGMPLHVTDSLCAFGFAVSGAGILRLCGEGELCEVQVEYRTHSGEWHPVEPSAISAVPAEELAPLRLGISGRQLWLEGDRQAPGWLRLYSLLGQELVRIPVPPGSGRWWTPLPQWAAGPYVAAYQTAQGVRNLKVVVPE